jgi:hypothetical protein
VLLLGTNAFEQNYLGETDPSSRGIADPEALPEEMGVTMLSQS